MREYFQRLEKKIKTKEDLVFFLEEIDLAEVLILKEPGKKISQKLKNKISFDLFEILKEIEKKEKQYQDAEGQVFFLRLLKKHLISLPKVRLEIAFDIPEVMLGEISQWFEDNFGKKFVLDIRVNPKIIGGTRLEYNGRWADFSLAKKIKENKSEIIAYE